MPTNKDYKELWKENTRDYNILARERLGDYEKIKTLESKYNELGVNCKGLLKLVENGFNKVSSTTIYLDDKIDNMRSELNGIYEVLEMDSDDIQALLDKVFNGFTRDQKEGV